MLCVRYFFIKLGKDRLELEIQRFRAMWKDLIDSRWISTFAILEIA